jgi:hypothetical protein
MFMVHELVYSNFFVCWPEEGVPSDLDEARMMDKSFGAGSYIAMCKHYDSEPDYPTGRCPDHAELGWQRVKDSYATRGPDPYVVEVLACGCHVMGFGPGDDVVVKRDPDPIDVKAD